jgi:hypothetical protein
MATSTIYLKNHGIPCPNVLIGLAFQSGGMTRALFTDRFGRAEIPHRNSGPASVLLNGQEIATIETPAVVDVEV